LFNQHNNNVECWFPNNVFFLINTLWVLYFARYLTFKTIRISMLVCFLTQIIYWVNSPSKMLGLYLYSLIIGYKICSGIYELNNIAKGISELQVRTVFFWQYSKIPTRTKQKGKHKYPCQSWELDPGPLSPQSRAFLSATESTKRIDWSHDI